MLEQQTDKKLSGLLIVTHGNYGDALINSARHVLGYQPKQCAALTVKHSDADADLHIERSIKALEMGLGVLILTDIYGATPSNMITKHLEDGNIAAVAGINLPMLIKCINYQDQGLAILSQKAIAGGREGVVHFDQQTCTHFQTSNTNEK